MRIRKNNKESSDLSEKKGNNELEISDEEVKSSQSEKLPPLIEDAECLR